MYIGRSDMHLTTPPGGASKDWIVKISAESVSYACGSKCVAEFRKINEEQYTSVNWFLFLERNSHCEIKERLDALYGDSFSFDGDREKLV